MPYHAISCHDEDEKDTTTTKKKRKRKIIWFNPPFRKNVRSNIDFQRNTIKVSYSCMQNIKSKISNHNRRLLEKNKKSTADKNLNCRNKECCPLDNQCLTTNVMLLKPKSKIMFAETRKNTSVIQLEPSRGGMRITSNLLTSNHTPQKLNFTNTHGSSKKTRDLISSSGQSLSKFLHTPPGEIVAIFALRKNFPY